MLRRCRRRRVLRGEHGDWHLRQVRILHCQIAEKRLVDVQMQRVLAEYAVVFLVLVYFGFTDKHCAHSLLVLLHMKLSKHSRFGTANKANKASKDRHVADAKDKDDSGAAATVSQLDEVHRKQAMHELKNCRLREECASARRLLNRRTVPGDCPAGASCPSHGRSKDAHGKSRGAHACDHSFPTELHVGLKHCPDQKNCGTYTSPV